MNNSQLKAFGKEFKKLCEKFNIDECYMITISGNQHTIGQFYGNEHVNTPVLRIIKGFAESVINDVQSLDSNHRAQLN